MTAEEILNRPVDAPSHPIEKRLTEHLVRRLMGESSKESTVSVPTKGMVSIQYPYDVKSQILIIAHSSAATATSISGTIWRSQLQDHPAKAKEGAGASRLP